MAIAVTHHTAANDGTDLSSYTTASITPTNGRLQLATVITRLPVTVGIPSITGGGVTTWTRFGSGAEFDFGATGNDFRIDLFYAYQASYGAGATASIAYGGAQWGCMWLFDEVSGIDTGGTNGADAIAQAIFSGANTYDATPNINLAALQAATSMAYGGFSSTAQAGTSSVLPTVGSGFTETGSDNTAMAPGTSIIGEYDLNVTAVGVSIGSGDEGWAGVAVELVEPSGIVVLRRRRS